MGRRGSAARLAAVLFTDIVDSSAIASRLGNARWKELIARHHAAVRRELKRFGGRELDTAGDGFFASFGDPDSAIRCACAAADAVRDLGIEIRAGVHFGSVEESGGKLAGIAVVVGARVMALGGAGDVLVTATTGELVAGGGFSFDDRGEHALKGLDGTWRVLAVMAVDGIPRQTAAEPAAAEERLATVQPAVLGNARRKPWLVVTAAVAALVLVAAIVTVRSRESPIQLPADSVSWIDAADGGLGGTTEIGARPGASAIGLGSFWVAQPDRDRVSRISLADGSITEQNIPVGTAPAAIAVDGGSVWVANAGSGTLSRINADANEATQEIPAGSTPTAIAAQDGTLWVSDRVGARLLVLNGDSGNTTKRIALPGQPAGVAVTEEGVWVAVAPAGLAQVDPATGAVVTVHDVGNEPTAVVAAFDSIWVSNHIDGTVTRLDPTTGTELATIPVGEGPGALAASESSLWVANGSDASLVEIDPTSNTASAPIPVGSAPASLAVDGAVLWLAAGASPTEHLGGTLRIASEESVLTFDPASAYGGSSWSILSITHDGLVAFRKAGGIDGSTIVPDLASAMPRVSDEGLTYRFPLRDGIRYSTGDLVQPEDFRRGLERAVLISGTDLYGAIIGADTCFGPKTCDLSEGVVTDDDAVTLRLSEQDPDLIFKLALPFATPAPPSVPAVDQLFDPVPGTGPYMISQASEESVEVVRNPVFQEWSAAAQPNGFVDAISWSFGDDPATTFDQVDVGEIDVMATTPRVEDLQAWVVEHPDRIIRFNGPLTLFVGFDVRQQPFDDERVRQALNLAIDRGAIVDMLGGPAVQTLTCQIIPPNYQGYDPFCPFTVDPGSNTWTGPDIDRARALVEAAGATDAPVTVWVTQATFPEGMLDAMRHVTKAANDIGLRATLEVIPDAEAEENYWGGLYGGLAPGDPMHPDVYVSGWQWDYPGAGNAIQPQFSCDGFANTSGLCDSGIDAAIDGALALQITDPGAANRAWADIEHRLVEEGQQAPITNPVAISLVSERTENVQTHPQWGILFSRIWVE